MTLDDYRRAFETAKLEFEALGDQRRAIDRRLTELAQTMASLSRLCGYVPTVSWGLTDGCRMILMSTGRPMMPTEVRDALTACGFDLTKYTNELAAVHTVLRRLNEAGEIRMVDHESGKYGFLYSSSRSWNVLGAGGRPARPIVLTAHKSEPVAPDTPPRKRSKRAPTRRRS